MYSMTSPCMLQLLLSAAVDGHLVKIAFRCLICPSRAMERRTRCNKQAWFQLPSSSLRLCLKTQPPLDLSLNEAADSDAKTSRIVCISACLAMNFAFVIMRAITVAAIFLVSGPTSIGVLRYSTAAGIPSPHMLIFMSEPDKSSLIGRQSRSKKMVWRTAFN